MNLATLNAAINGMTGDGDSCRFYKRWKVMQRMTKKELAAIIDELHSLEYPGCGKVTNWRHLRDPKIELARWVDFKIERLAAR